MEQGMNKRATICLMLKSPRSGEVKTCLGREIGFEEAERIYRRLVEKQVEQLSGEELEVHYNWVSKIVATPRMHGMHHSVVERDSNWSSGLSIWDWLHGTLHQNIPQRSITPGTTDYQEAKLVTLPKILILPVENPGS
jgi:hypothetical protein